MGPDFPSGSDSLPDPVAFCRSYSLCLLLLLSTAVSAQPYLSIGPKLGFTFGETDDLTLGFEVSFFPMFENSVDQAFHFGLTFDATFWKDHASYHLGAEAIGAGCLGADFGPTLVSNDQGSTLGLGMIFFAGLVFYPYYELVMIKGKSPYKATGLYMKMPTGWWFGGGQMFD
jgi:hypothetical protein